MADKDKYGIIDLTQLDKKIDAQQNKLDLLMKTGGDASGTYSRLHAYKFIKEQCELLPSAEEVFDAGEARVFAKWEHEESAPMRDLMPKQLPQSFDQFIENYKKP